MSLCELVIAIQNNSIIQRNAAPEEAKGIFEYFRERNYLVHDVCQGKTTFAQSLRKASQKPMLKRPWQFFKKSDEQRNLDYLLQPTLVKLNPFEKNTQTILIPKDYYVDNKFYQPNSKVMALLSLPVNAATYIVLPFAALVVFSNFGYYLSGGNNSVSAATGISASVLALSCVVSGRIANMKRRSRSLQQTAEKLDKLAAGIYGTGNAKTQLPDTDRNADIRSAKRIAASAYIEYSKGRYEVCISKTLEAVKLNPTSSYYRKMLIRAYTLNKDFHNAFRELREARILFGNRMNHIDSLVSATYARALDLEGKSNDTKIVIGAMINRVGVDSAKKVIKSVS